MSESKFNVSFQDIKEAAQTIAPVIAETPLIYDWYSSHKLLGEIYLKLENTNIVKSFKIRGALNAVCHLTESQKQAGVIGASAGNHAQGLAYSATKMGVKSIICMPSNAPLSKINATLGFGGEVVLSETPLFDDALKLANELMEKNHYTLVPPFDNKYVIAGQGTIGLELLKQNPQIDTIVCPIGGGGLIAGIAIAIKHLNPKIKIIGIQTERFPGMKRSLENNKLEGYALGQPTIADGIAVKTPGKLTYPIIKELVDEIITVSEHEIIDAIEFLAEYAKIITEGAGAAAFAAILSKKVPVKDKKVAVIATGGNIDPDRLVYVLKKSLARQKRRFNLSLRLQNTTDFENLMSAAHSSGAKLYNLGSTEPIESIKDLYQDERFGLIVFFFDKSGHEKFFNKLKEFNISYKKLENIEI